MCSMPTETRTMSGSTPEEIWRGGGRGGVRLSPSPSQPPFLPSPRLLLVGELLVRRGGGRDDERLGVAHVGEVARKPHAVDELGSGRAAWQAVRGVRGGGGCQAQPP